MRACTTIALFLGLALPVMVNAQKTDTTFLFNGDHIVGEIKDLKLGLLRVSTDYMAFVYIEWDQIQTIRTNKRWDIRTNTGAHYLGHLSASPRLDHVYIVTGEDSVHINLIDIVTMYRLNKGIWPRTDGTLSAGYTYQRANELSQLSLSGNATYRADHGAVNFAFSSITTEQPDVEDNRKQDVSMGWEHYLWNSWSTSLVGGAESNTELDLELRLKVNLALGKYLVQAVHTSNLLGGGIQANRERTGTNINSDNLEVFIGNQLRVKTYRFPKLEITVNAVGYYGLTIRDRIRAQAELKFRYEVVKDLLVGIEFYDQYDRAPLDGGDALNDFRVATTLSYTF